MGKTEKTKVGDTIFSLNNDSIVEWEIIAINPKNKRFFIIVSKERDSITQVHWKTLEYGGDNKNFLSLTKADLLQRFKSYANGVITNLSKEKED